MKLQLSPIILLMMLTATGCAKLVAVGPPDGYLDHEKVFSHDTIAEKALLGVYTQIMAESNILNGNLSRWGCLYSDDITRSFFSDRDTGFQQVTLTASYNPLISCWNKPYQFIFGCNTILEGLRQSASLSDTIKRQLEGEALFLRALSYSYLVNLFGDVPLVLATRYEHSANLPRTTQRIVYDTMLADLQQASQLLPAGYAGLPAFATKKIRANKWAAKALQARIYLYRQQWQQAAAVATEVIQNGGYRLCSDLGEVFRYESPETILQLQPSTLVTEATLFLNQIASRPVYEPTTALLSAFESGDQRKETWMKKTAGFYAITKYRQYSGIPHEYNVLLRLSEIYLIRAEAYARLARAQDARNDIDNIRIRAGLSHLPATANILIAIARERRSEFFAELGHRYFDLKRWMDIQDTTDTLQQLAEQAMTAKPHWGKHKKVWPIPASEISANSLLTQNPGY